MPSLEKAKNHLAVALAFASLPLVYCWHALHRAYPRGHDAMNFGHAHKIAEAIAAFNYELFYQLVFIEKSFKAQLYPLLSSPFVLLFHKMVPSIALYQCSVWTLFIYYLYATLALFLPRSSLYLICATISTTPWLIHNALSFNAEMTFLLGAAMTTYHLLRSTQTNRWPHAVLAAFGFFVAATTHIGATGVCLLIFVPWLIVHVAQSKTLRTQPALWLAAASCVLQAGLLATPIFLKRPLAAEEISKLALAHLVIAASGLIMFFIIRTRALARLCLAISLSALCVALWYLPVFYDVYTWAWMSGFSEAWRTKNEEGLWIYIKFFFGHTSPALLLLVLPAAIFASWRHKLWRKSNSLKAPLLVAFAAFVLCFCIGLSSLNGDIRYYYAPLLFVAVTTFTLYSRTTQQTPSWVRNGLPLAALVTQVLFFVSSSAATLMPAQDLLTGSLNLRWPPYGIPIKVMREDPTREVITWVGSVTRSDTRAKKTVSYLMLNDTDQYAMDPYLLWLACKEENSSLEFVHVSEQDPRYAKQNLVSVAQNIADYYLADVLRPDYTAPYNLRLKSMYKQEVTWSLYPNTKGQITGQP